MIDLKKCTIFENMTLYKTNLNNITHAADLKIVEMRL